MNQWGNGQTSQMFPHQTATPAHLNPQMYSNLGNGGQFDLSQFTQGLQNGSATSTPTPSFPSQTFQPGSVIPAKRPHDGMSGSPVQAQHSRSQTPNFGGAFPNQQGGQQFPNPYAHLQQSGSSNATPSPTMQNQQFRPPTQQQQRMQNASPSAFQQQGNFGNQMSPVNQQNSAQPTSMPQNQMAQMAQQYAMNNGNTMGMSGMANSMQGQMGNAANTNLRNAQQIYQQRLMQQQAQLRNSGMMAQRAMAGQQGQMFNNAGQQRPNSQMANGSASAQMNANALQVQQQQKKAGFIQTIRTHVTQQGKHFDEHPSIGGRPVDYLMLWTIVTQLSGYAAVERAGQWQLIANKMGFPQVQYPTAAEELKQLHAHAITQYERMWFAAKQQASKQEQARMHAHQMAGVGGMDQASPTKTIPNNQQSNQFAQYQQQNQPQATPVQTNAQLPQNGMTTPQQQMLQHRRNSSLRKPEQMTPQAMGQSSMPAPSPHSAGKAVQRSPSIKREPSAVPMIHASPQSSNYEPVAQAIETEAYGPLDYPQSFQTRGHILSLSTRFAHDAGDG